MRQRLDVALVTLGLAVSRTQARTLVRAGLVRIDGAPATRVSTRIEDQQITVEGDGAGGEAEWIRLGYVGRGALKLEHALTTWPVGVSGRRCLDVGASTGGFTQVLLRRGARQVIALDVGHDQLDPGLAADPRVIERSGVSVREVSADDLGGGVDVLVADLSFISLTVVLPALASLCSPGADLVLLIKPQFEVGRAAIGRTGVVRSPTQREQVLTSLDASARATGLVPLDLDHSPVTGGSGNIEYLWWLRRCSHPGRCPDPTDGMMGCGRPSAELESRRRALIQEERV